LPRSSDQTLAQLVEEAWSLCGCFLPYFLALRLAGEVARKRRLLRGDGVSCAQFLGAVRRAQKQAALGSRRLALDREPLRSLLLSLSSPRIGAAAFWPVR